MGEGQWFSWETQMQDGEWAPVGSLKLSAVKGMQRAR